MVSKSPIVTDQTGHQFADHLVALAEDYTPPTQADEDEIAAIFAEHRAECDRMANEEVEHRQVVVRPS